MCGNNKYMTYESLKETDETSKQRFERFWNLLESKSAINTPTENGSIGGMLKLPDGTEETVLVAAFHRPYEAGSLVPPIQKINIRTSSSNWDIILTNTMVNFEASEWYTIEALDILDAIEFEI